MLLSREIETFFKTSGCAYEDWRDIASVLINFVRSKGHTPLQVLRPSLTGLGTYMYIVPFKKDGGEQVCFLVYDDEAGVYEIVTNQPDPAAYS